MASLIIRCRETQGEYRGIRYLLVDYSEESNPEVVNIVAELNKAISTNNKELVIDLAGKLVESLGKVVKPIP